jgi:serine/threonine protein kinase
MSESSTGPDPLDDLAEEFLARWRLGERPSLSEYTANFPELAERIRSVFPALLVMLEFGSEAGRPPDPHVVFPRSESEGPTRLGEYLLLRRVGSGGMGIVYEAIQESLGRHVALKTLPSQHGSDGTWLERFQREARAAARLHHNNIVPVYGIGEHDGLHYYTMQFIRGHGLDVVLREVKRLRGDPNASDAAAASGGLIESISLANELQTGRFPSAKAESTQRVEPSVNGRLADRVIASRRGETASLSSELSDRSGLSEQPEAQYVHSIARVGALVASALDYAHQQGVLHRDIKPANLMLDAQGQIWITDFGLAKAEGSDELTRTGDIVGTLRYMAPERFNGWSDRRSDVYALGATLYELLSLRPAFEESDRIKLIDQIVQQSPCLLRQIDRRIPRDLETIVLKSLAKEPGDRYPTAGQLAEDLHRFVEGRPILARRSGVAERLWRWSKRNRLLAAAAGAATAALVAVAVISLIFATEQARANRENRRLAHELGQKSDRLKDSLADSTRLLAIRNFDRGQAAFDKGQIGAGLHWMIESWRAAVDAGDRDRQHAARTSLAAWQSHHARLKAVFSHGSPVAAAAFSPDSKFVLTASADRTAQLWNVGTGKPIGKPMLHPGAVLTVAFSPNGTTVVTGCTDGVARLWDITTFRTVGLPLIHAGAVNAVAFQPRRQHNSHREF